MSKILIIGDYYPLFSFRSGTVEMVAAELAKDHCVVLLSTSWCKVKNYTFCGTVEELSRNGPFSKRYFIDPMQLKSSDIDIQNALLGLGSKIIEREGIDQIIFIDDLRYSPIVELLTHRFNIPSFLFLYNFEGMRYTLDNYACEFIPSNFMSYNLIFTYLPYKDFLMRYHRIDDTKIRVALPMQYSHLRPGNEELNLNDIYIFPDEAFLTEPEKHWSKVRDFIHNTDKKIHIITVNESFHQYVQSKVSEFGNADLIQFKRNANIAPENSLVLCTGELLHNKLIDYNMLMNILARKCCALVKQEHLSALEEYQVDYFKMQDFYVVTHLGQDSTSVRDFFKEV